MLDTSVDKGQAGTGLPSCATPERTSLARPEGPKIWTTIPRRNSIRATQRALLNGLCHHALDEEAGASAAIQQGRKLAREQEPLDSEGRELLDAATALYPLPKS